MLASNQAASQETISAADQHKKDLLKQILAKLDLGNVKDMVGILYYLVDPDYLSKDYTVTPHGYALDAYSAARCATDYPRTEAFLRGGKIAIDEMLDTVEGEVLVLEAGSGPLGMLSVPLAVFYEDNPRVKFVAVDLHKSASSHLNAIVRKLGLNHKYLGIINDNLFSWTPEKLIGDKKFHVILSEIMAAGLLGEPQVAIMKALMPHLHPQGKFLPEGVRVYVGVRPTAVDGDKQDAGTLIELTRQSIHTIGDRLNGTVQLPAQDKPHAITLCTEVTPIHGVELKSGHCIITRAIEIGVESGPRQAKALTVDYPFGGKREDITVTREVVGDDDSHTRTYHPFVMIEIAPGRKICI